MKEKSVILNKKHAMKDRPGNIPYYYNDNWITNGKFIINKSLVKEAHKYCAPFPEGFSQPDFATLLERDYSNAKLYKKTSILYDLGLCIRLFINEEKQQAVWIAEEFVKDFELEEISAISCYDPVSAYNGFIIIMPCRAPDYESLQDKFNQLLKQAIK